MNTKNRVVLFQTPHGSHLYGTSHPLSDRDVFTVVEKLPYPPHNGHSKYARQTIKDGLDETVVDLSTFLNGCASGVPQYLEAMFSHEATIDHLEEFRAQYHVGSAVVPTYIRTIKSFSYDERDGGTKKRRHALRLALNARDILRYGRFNPRLPEDRVAELWALAESLDGEECCELATSWVWD